MDENELFKEESLFLQQLQWKITVFHTQRQSALKPNVVKVSASKIHVAVYYEGRAANLSTSPMKTPKPTTTKQIETEYSLCVQGLYTLLSHLYITHSR